MEDMNTYAAIFAGIFTLEFLDGWFGFYVKIMIACLLTYQFIRLIKRDFKNKKKQEPQDDPYEKQNEYEDDEDE